MLSNVLIIDKRKELSTKYKKSIEDDQTTVIISRNLKDAMFKIQTTDPDIIIVSDSIEEKLSDFCSRIRALTYNTRPVIIALSKSADSSDRILVLESGADDFISEPVNSDEFVMRVKAHLRREFESSIDKLKHLPNQNYSMRAIKRILSSDNNWACMLISIENFENYKESYSKLASDKLIQTYTAIITSSLSETDYLGSISDNEFLIITEELKAEKIANFLIFAFDMVAGKFYSEQDKERGFMIMQGDSEAGRRSDFVHTTIGVVTAKTRKYKDNQELVTDLINIHNLAKLPDKSNYLIERTKLSGENSVYEKTYNNKILINEPDDALSLLLSTILKLQGYEIIHADSDEVPAVIIIDSGSEDSETGLSACKNIKENEKYKDTKLIMTSIYHDKEAILKAGADLYLPKPYEIEELVRWVDLFIKENNNL